MLSLLYSLLFVIMFYIFYQYGNNIYNIDRSTTEVKYLLLPNSYQDQYKPSNLRGMYSDMFNINSRDLNLIKSQDSYEK